MTFQRGSATLPRMPKPLKDRLSPPIVKALKERHMSNAEAAQKLDVNANYLSNVFNTIAKRNKGVVTAHREAMRDLVAARRAVRLREAEKVLNFSRKLSHAAKIANCSERTIRRYVHEIKEKNKQQRLIEKLNKKSKK